MKGLYPVYIRSAKITTLTALLLMSSNSQKKTASLRRRPTYFTGGGKLPIYWSKFGVAFMVRKYLVLCIYVNPKPATNILIILWWSIVDGRYRRLIPSQSQQWKITFKYYLVWPVVLLNKEKSLTRSKIHKIQYWKVIVL